MHQQPPQTPLFASTSSAKSSHVSGVSRRVVYGVTTDVTVLLYCLRRRPEGRFVWRRLRRRSERCSHSRGGTVTRPPGTRLGMDVAEGDLTVRAAAYRSVNGLSNAPTAPHAARGSARSSLALENHDPTRRTEMAAVDSQA